MGLSPFEVPLDPDAERARDLLAEELAKREYQEARPTWFDELLRSLTEWMDGLQVGNAEGPPAFGLLVVLIVVAALIVLGLLIFGLPRLNRRSAVTGALFGEDDERSAAQMRAAAESAAAAGDYGPAIAEMFRAVARGLAERTIVLTSPGTTATGFAARAGRSFPDHAPALVTAAGLFDEVRYLGGTGGPEQYASVERLERQLRAARPAALEEVGA